MRMLVVDDDDQIREGITHGIKWNELGIDGVEGCKNGAEALARIREIYFDILITDISMPEMSGVDLMRCAKEVFPDIHVILISGYKEFEYAEAGIRYGADDYILKPIHINELMDTVTKVMGKIDNRKENLKNRTMAKELLRNQIMNKIMQDKIEDPLEIQEYLLSNSGFKRIHTLLGVVLMDDSGTYGLADEKQKDILLKKSAEYLAGYAYTFFQVDGNESFLLIDVVDSTLMVYQLKQQVKRAIESINREINGSISAGVSEQGSLAEITQIYWNAKYALEFRFFYGKGICLFYQNCIEVERRRNIEVAVFQKDKLMHILEEGSEEDIFELVETYKKELFGCKKEHLQRILFKSMIDINKEYTSEMANEMIRQDIFDAESFTDMIELWKNFMLSALKKKMEGKKYGRDICNALDYIRGHYQEKISVEEVADLLGISAGHFSRTFKQQVGISFVKYLNQYRMDKAEELLKNTNLKVYEIAEQVGITDYLYFTQVFRNIKGKAPKDVRRTQ